MKRKYSIDMTSGPFLKKILIFALPLILTGLLQLVYNSADTIIVGRFAGKESLAAVGATGSLINLIINVFMGLSMGSGVMEARYIGEKNGESQHHCTHTAMLLSVICGFAVAVIGFFFSGQFLILMNSPKDVIELSTLYLKIYFLGAPGSLVFNFGASLVRATGDTRRPLYILLCSGLINVILNLILVIPFKMGVAGVAVATITSQYISAVCIVVCLSKMNGEYRLYIKKMKIYKRELLAILRIGLPAGFQNSLFSISNVIIQSAVNTFGSNAMAGIAAGSNFDGYIYTCTNAVAQTAMTFSSQNMGAKKYENIDRIFRKCLLMAAIAALVLSGAGFVLRDQIVSFFSNEPEVIKIGAERIKLVLPFYVFCSLQDVVAGQLRGLGRSTEPMIVSVFGACGVRLLWIFFALPFNPTLMNLYWAYPISWFVTFVALIVLYVFVRRRIVGKEVE